MGKKQVSLFLVFMMVFTLIPPTISFADGEEMSAEFKAVLNEEGKFIINSVKPETEEEGYILISEWTYISSGYMLTADNYDETTQTADLSLLDEYGSPQETHNVEVVFNYDEGIASKAEVIMDSIPTRDDGEPYYFTVKDMELINYWVSRTGNEYVDETGGGLDNYSGELKKYLNNQNFKLIVDNRAGLDEDFKTERLGMAFMTHNGVAYSYDVAIGTKAEHIIYVPDETGDSKAEILAAVQKRIDEYIGAGKVEVIAGEETVYELKIAGYDGRIQGITYQYNNVKPLYDSHKSQVDAKQAEITARQEELNALIAENSTEINEKWELKENTIPTQIAEKQAQIDALDPESSDYADLWVQYDQDMLALQNALTQAEGEYNQLVEQGNMYQSELESFYSSEHNLSIEYNNLYGQLVQYEMQCNNFLSMIEGIEAEKEYFKEAYNDPDSEYYYLQSAVGGYYFLAELENGMYAFLVAKDSSKMLTPTATTVDATTNVSVSTDNTTVPLDTIVTVEELSEGETYDKIIQKLGVTDNATFDITLYSDAWNKNITKLEDGTFSVKIPVPTELNGKELIAYYVDANDKVVEYPVTVKDGYASFATDHFSIYTIAAKATTPAVDTTVSTPDGDTKFEVKAEAGVVPEGGKLVVENITEKVDVKGNVEKVLASEIKTDKYQIFEISLLDASDKEIQPNGTIAVTTSIPEGFDAKNIVVYRINDDNTKTLIEISVDENSKTVTMYLDHFSTYVIAEKAQIPSKGENPLMGLWIATLMVGGAIVLFGAKKKFEI